MKQTRPVVDVERVHVVRAADGSIQDRGTVRPIRVEATHVTVTETLAEDGEVIESDLGPGATARLEYAFEGGTARMCRFVNTNGDVPHANWTGPDFLRILPVADEAVANLPVVEEVTPARKLLGKRTARER